MDGLSTELRIFRHVRHPNIVAFFGVCLERRTQEAFLVEELVKGEVLSRHPDKNIRSITKTVPMQYPPQATPGIFQRLLTP